MRKTIYIVLAALGLCLFAGCGSSDKEKVSPTAKQLVGEWQLKTWTGETPQDFDIYLSFGADNTFEIYQRLAEVKYQKFTGIQSFYKFVTKFIRTIIHLSTHHESFRHKTSCFFSRRAYTHSLKSV